MDPVSIEPEGESRTSFDFDSAVLLEEPSPSDDVEIVIGGRKSVQFSIASRESIYDKWKDKVEENAQIIVS